MKTEQEIINILTDTFSSVYCGSCSSQTLDNSDDNCHCEDCHRKSMGWGLSIKYAKSVAKDILT